MNCRSTISKPLPQGRRAKASRRFSPVSYREHGLPVSENLLKQDFCASDPNHKWASDIMYLLTDEGWQYLAVVIDLWSRVVIGWPTPQLACDALQMVLWRRRRPEKVIVHTVHDGQYCSADIRYYWNGTICRAAWARRVTAMIMPARKASSISLKVECFHCEHFASREIMRTAVFNYIECDYSRWDRHRYCGGLSPEQFESPNLVWGCVHNTRVRSNYIIHKSGKHIAGRRKIRSSATGESRWTAMAVASRHNNTQSSVLYNAEVIVNGSSCYGNRESIPRRLTKMWWYATHLFSLPAWVTIP